MVVSGPAPPRTSHAHKDPMSEIAALRDGWSGAAADQGRPTGAPGPDVARGGGRAFEESLLVDVPATVIRRA